MLLLERAVTCYSVRKKIEHMDVVAIRRETTEPGRFNESEKAMAPVKGAASHSVEPS